MEKKLVPKLRFPEFENLGVWSENSLDTAIKSESSSIALNKLELKVIGYPVYGADGIVGFTDFFIQKEDYIAVIKDGSGVGKLFLYPKESSILGTMAYLKSKDSEEYNLIFFYFLLQNVNLSVYVKGSGIPHIYFSDFGKEKIGIPQPSEQQKIADCLSSLDDLITAENEKLDALKNHKKGLMQQLFPSEGEKVPKLRFPEFKDCGDWEFDYLTGDGVAQFVNKKIDFEELSLNTYVSTENLLSDYTGVVMASRLPSYGSFTEYKNNDILLSNIRPYLKKVWFSDRAGATSNDVIVIRAKSKLKASFLSCLLINDDFINYIMKGAEGVKMPRGDKDAIKNYQILFPNKDEQQKIVDFLLPLNEQINEQTRKNEGLKLHKKGLMQKLFPN